MDYARFPVCDGVTFRMFLGITFVILFFTLMQDTVNINFIKYKNKKTLVPGKSNQNWTEVSEGPIKTMKGWTGVPAIIHQSRNGTVFCYATNHNTSVGKPLILQDVYKKRFDWPPQKYINLNIDTDVSCGFVFVTGASENHFNESLDSISTVQKMSPRVKIIFWDLGLDGISAKKIQFLCDVEYRMLNFSAYPVHVRYLRNYAFKPIIVAETLRDYPSLVWLDSSIRLEVTGNFSHVKPQVLQTGGVLQMVSTAHSIYSATHKQLYEYLPCDWERTKHTEMGGATMFTLYRTEHVFKNFLLFWVLCALDVNCIEPTRTLNCNRDKLYAGDYAGCHRFDQSVMSVLLANAYSYNFNLYRNTTYVEVSRKSYQNLPLKVCKL